MGAGRMEVKSDSYVNIQAFMVNELHLSGNALIIYAVIYGFSQDGDSWFTGSRSYLAAWCQASKSTVSRNLEALCADGLIERREHVADGVLLVDYRAVRGTQNGQGCTQNGQGCTQNGQGGVPKMSTHTIEIDTLEKNPREKIETRHKYGEYKNVLLTDSDMKKLKTEFPTDWEERIERLSSYMASSGKSYKNHLATIRNWARRDREARKNTVSRETSSGFDKKIDADYYYQSTGDEELDKVLGLGKYAPKTR
jgi:hypothetical protein